jgi:hypothetical protein
LDGKINEESDVKIVIEVSDPVQNRVEVREESDVEQDSNEVAPAVRDYHEDERPDSVSEEGSNSTHADQDNSGSESSKAVQHIDQTAAKQEYMPANGAEKKGTRPSLVNRDESTFLAFLPECSRNDGRTDIEAAAGLVFDPTKANKAELSFDRYIRRAMILFVSQRSTCPPPSGAVIETSSESGVSSESEDVVDDVAESAGITFSRTKRRRDFLNSDGPKKQRLESDDAKEIISSQNLEGTMLVDGTIALPHRSFMDSILLALHEK